MFDVKSVDNRVNKSFGEIECAAAAFVLLLCIIAAAITRGKIKKNHPEWGEKFFTAVIARGIIIFSI